MRHWSSLHRSQIASGFTDLRKQAVAIEENLKNDPDFVKVITKARKKPKPEERNLFQ
jgi:hypothetical protein